MTASSSLTSLSGLPYIQFLAAYPHPAFILPGSPSFGSAAPSLTPIFSNESFRALLLGPDADTAEVGPAFLKSLDSAEAAKCLSMWLDSTCSFTTPEQLEARSETLDIELRIFWLPPESPKVRLVLSQTTLSDYIICTSTPRDPPLVRYVPPPEPPRTKQPASPSLGRAGRTMRLPDFPLTPVQMHSNPASLDKEKFATLMRTPTNSRRSSRSPDNPSVIRSPSNSPKTLSSNGSNKSSSTTGTPAIPPTALPSHDPSSPTFVPQPTGAMRKVIEAYDWTNTPLGPRSEWGQSLTGIVDYMLAHPLPIAVWWGTELVLLYNDAYREVAGHKHPQIFAEHGAVSWAELWERIGPEVNNVYNGIAVARRDDLCFLNKMTEAKLPEETYHSWQWVPIILDGVVKGFLNGTYETTTKVITERRMNFLRELTSNLGFVRTTAEFTDVVLSTLGSFTIDCPFAALYSVSVTEYNRTPTTSRPRTSYIDTPADAPPLNIDLKLAGTVGVPPNHPSVPSIVNLSLDPLTFKPSPSVRPSRGTTSSPVPTLHSYRSHDSVTTALPKTGAGTGVESPIIYADSGTPSGDATSYVSLPGRAGTPSSVPRAGTPGSSSISGASLPAVVNARETGSSTHSPQSTSAVGGATCSSIPEHAAPWPFAEAFATRRAVHVPALADYVVEGFDSSRGWGEPAREAVVIPITVDSNRSDYPAAMLVIGLNSRRPYDEDYAGYIDLLRAGLGAQLTAVKGREADLIRAEHLSQLDSAKTAFFSNASHELRTPLTLISGPLQDALASLPDSRAKDSLKMAARNVTRLSRLVDSLMDFSKLAANRLEGRFRPVVLGEYSADLASLFRSVIEKSRIEYIVDCDSTDKRTTYIDPDFWEKIVFNLIGNAFKYTLRGSIRVSLEYDADHAYFHVKDTGVGIPQSDIDKIFDRFHRVDAISRSHEGTGIGLALTKELTKLHGGTLSVTSATAEELPDDHGSKFTVTIPLGSDHLPAAHIVQADPELPQYRPYARGILDEVTQWAVRHPDERTPSESSDSGGSSEGSRMDPSTLFFVKSDVILLVDDNADMRRYIKSLFIPYCQVVEASNGQEALHLLDEVKPNLILSDVMMPVLDGYGLISHVRQRPDTRLTPIILVTAKESEEARVEGLLSGADDYMSKPFTGKELIARVHLQMQLGKRRTELETKFMERTREIQLLSDLSPVGICRADADRHILYVNDRWFEISGLCSDGSLDSWFDCVQEEDQQVAKDLWDAAFESTKSSSMETRFKNGTYAKWSLQPLRTEDGGLSGVISTITDVSDQRLFEAARLQHAQEREALARKRAEEAEERRKEADERRRGQELLIDVTSHELRQPVSAILNCSSLVRANLAGHRDELGRFLTQKEPFKPSESLLRAIDEDLEALDAIYQCGLAQERIANDVLSLSRIQLQILSIHPVEFDLIAEAQRIVSIFRNELKMKRINLDLIFGDNFKTLNITRVRSDKSRCGQVITNLLSNGIKFTDTSTGKRDITVIVDISRRAPAPDGPCIPPSKLDGLTEEDEIPVDPNVPTKVYLYVAVKDSGPGLKPDDLALLFKRFQQGSNSHNVFGGSGLGLFVSRKLCDLMGGRIDVDSTYGNGATFRFFVEAMTASPTNKDAEHPLDSGESGENLSVAASVADVHLKIPLHILITEDNLINQTVLNRQLVKAGCSTVLANNGLQAIKKIKELANSKGSRKVFDAILMDCEMPVMDGLTAVREIRRMEESGELPVRSRVFALTGNAREGQVESAREAGMDEVIIKPYRLDELLNKIQGMIKEACPTDMDMT